MTNFNKAMREVQSGESPSLLFDRLIPAIMKRLMVWRQTGDGVSTYELDLARLIDAAIRITDGGEVDTKETEDFMIIALDFANKMRTYHDNR